MGHLQQCVITSYSIHYTKLYEFRWRSPVIAVFILVTVLFGAAVLQLRIDAGFDKMLPLDHPYMRTYVEYRDAFGGANRILVALMAKDGNMFTPEFFDELRLV